MIITCFRCGKELNSPNASNADYIIAKDTVEKEPREVTLVLKENQATLAKRARIIEENSVLSDTRERVTPTEDFIRNQFAESEYTIIEAASVAQAVRDLGENFVRAKVEVREKAIQKTAVICTTCYRETDVVIWGVHRR